MEWREAETVLPDVSKGEGNEISTQTDNEQRTIGGLCTDTGDGIGYRTSRTNRYGMDRSQ